MAAKRGYALVFSQSLLHAGWSYSDPSGEPRKGFHISWVAEGVSIGGMRFNDNSGRIDGVRERSRLRVDRKKRRASAGGGSARRSGAARSRDAPFRARARHPAPAWRSFPVFPRSCAWFRRRERSLVRLSSRAQRGKCGHEERRET